ncbi:MAG: hypothetical protein SVN78_10510 [Deferribacterota bacterium]|nr:hypothetical protein [Deferribacterota bacterium]
MIIFKELGLVNTRNMYKKAIKEGFAVPGYKFDNFKFDPRKHLKAAREEIINMNKHKIPNFM